MPRRPEFREETPKEGMCGRSCRTATISTCGASKCKIFLSFGAELARYATFLPQRRRGADMQAEKFDMPNNGLCAFYAQTGESAPTKATWLLCAIRMPKSAPFTIVSGGARDDRRRFRRLRRQARASFERSDPAVLPQRDRRRGQIARRRVRSGHRSRPRRRGGDAPADRPDLSRPRRDRRGIRRRTGPTPNMSGCSIRSTAPRASFPACRPGAR